VPTVSICLPVYNGELFLKEAIESALAQTHADFELLISDDASQDSSLKIARDYAGKDPRVVVWSNPQNVGLFGNYNVCLSRAGGKYIKPFAQDDLLHPEMLAKMLETFSLQPETALVSTKRLVIEKVGTLPRMEQFDSSRMIPGDEAIKDCLLSRTNWIGEPSTVMFPSSLVGSGFDTSFYHSGDIEYWFRIIRGGNYIFLNEPLCTFRRHDSTTNKNLKSLLFSLDLLRLGRLYCQDLAAAGVDADEYVRQCIKKSAGFVHDQVRKDALTCEDSVAVSLGSAGRDQLLTQFRELAFYALYYVQEETARAQGADPELIAIAERLRRSKIWRARQALKALVRGSAV
jgi:hypothetical protein